MIDTDKYEGHTGPWKLNKPVENGDYTIQDEMGTYRGTFYSRFRVEDARLMADAPELLDMVKAAYAYSDYVMSGFEEEVEGTGQTYVESGWEPVCFMEFYDDEWQIMKEAKKND